MGQDGPLHHLRHRLALVQGKGPHLHKHPGAVAVLDFGRGAGFFCPVGFGTAPAVGVLRPVLAKDLCVPAVGGGDGAPAGKGREAALQRTLCGRGARQRGGRFRVPAGHSPGAGVRLKARGPIRFRNDGIRILAGSPRVREVPPGGAVRGIFRPRRIVAKDTVLSGSGSRHSAVGVPGIRGSHVPRPGGFAFLPAPASGRTSARGDRGHEAPALCLAPAEGDKLIDVAEQGRIGSIAFGVPGGSRTAFFVRVPALLPEHARVQVLPGVG